jgi:peptidoglycan/LPS O-acetylase OafA/YrhL
MQEIKSHTALRGIAALLVVIFHYRTVIKSEFDLDAYTHFFSKGYLWVDCFFVLSGFILCYVYGTGPCTSLQAAGRFLNARFARIYPLHLATLLFLVALMFVLPAISHQAAAPVPWAHFILNLFDIHAWGFLDSYDFNFPSWSISVEFAAYLAFPLICFALMRSKAITVTLMLTIIVSRVCFVALVDVRAHWEQFALLAGLPMFFVGVLLFQDRISFGHISQNTISKLQLFSVALILTSMHFGMNDNLAPIGFAVFIFSSQKDEGYVARMLNVRVLVAIGR